MNCQDARESLATLLDGDISLTERVPIELHVNACPECQQKLAELQALRPVADAPAPRPVHHWHWPPVLAADTVGRALGLMRADDVVTRMRRLVLDRFPPRHLAIAAAVPLVAILAIFVFERGFKVGAAMRQRAISPAAPVAQAPSPSAAPRGAAVEPAPAATPVAPLAPVLPPRSVTAPRPAPPTADTPKPARTKPVETRIAETKAAETKVAEVKPADGKSTTRTTTSDTTGKPAAPSSATPVKASLSTTTSAPGKTLAAATMEGATRSTVDVIGRLRVKSRSEAERDLGALVARAGGTFIRRQHGPATTVLEARVPQAAYGTFAQGVNRLGSWQLEAERSPLPDLVHVTVRLAE